MSATQAFSLPTPSHDPAPITTAAQAREAIAHLTDVMDALVAIVQEETELVRAGKLAAANGLEPTKTELTRRYVSGTLRLRSNRKHLSDIVPDLLADLRKHHDLFRALLQINLTVLATAHAVSESIVRGVSSELARTSAPQTYGASGRPVAPPRN